MDDLSIVLAVPPQSVLTPLRSGLLEHDANGIGEADRVMRGVWGQEEHFTLMDRDIPMYSIIDDLEEHGATVLIEPFGGLIDMEIGAGIGAANDLPSHQPRRVIGGGECEP